jgi:plasmid stabilization system protein ParE
MNVRKPDEFISDIERQFEWYVLNAGEDVAEHYLAAIQSTCQLLGQHPQLGPRAGFTHPRLCDWRFFVVFRPFKKHVIFYEIIGDDVIMRRTMHGHRDLPRRLLESPEGSA